MQIATKLFRPATVLVAALAAAGAVPAVAQTANVTFYGTAHLDFDFMKVDVPGARTLPAGSIGRAPATAGLSTINRVTNDSSLFGVRGQENLGGGLTVAFQIESSITADAGGGTLAGRNTGILVSGPWGQVIVGQWDVPYIFVSATRVEPFYNITFGSGRSLIGEPGFGVPVTTAGTRLGAAGDANFDRRQGNSVQYWTPPSLGGFHGRVAYSTGERDDATGQPWLLSTLFQYEARGFFVAYGYERHEDYFGLTAMGVGGSLGGAANPSSTDQGHRVGATYQFGPTFVGAVWERLMYENDDTRAGNVRKMRRDAWYLGVRHAIGPWMIRGGYGQAYDAKCSRVGGGTCNGDDTGARTYSIGASYSLSRRTDVWAMYGVVDNEDFALYTPQFGTSPGQFVGGKYQGFGVGLRHLF